jgi:hypothetical protein
LKIRWVKGGVHTGALVGEAAGGRRREGTRLLGVSPARDHRREGVVIRNLPHHTARLTGNEASSDMGLYLVCVENGKFHCATSP